MRYNAGSEVYTQGLAQALARRHEVHVFTRQENAFLPEYAVHRERDTSDPRITLHVVNMARARDGYRHAAVDTAFAGLLDEVRPEVVHIGHLNHLSTSLVFEARERRIPVVLTLHDYWLMCPRGQFIQMYPEDPSDVWSVCDGQDDRKCAVRCYVRYFSGDEEEYETDAAHWTDWVGRRMSHVWEVCDAVDMFIAPSRYLLRRFRDDFGIPEGKLTYLDYGFHRRRTVGRSRTQGEPFTFGYIGTHIPAKGVNHLIESFGGVPGNSRAANLGTRPGRRDCGTEGVGQKPCQLCGQPGGVDGRVQEPGYRRRCVEPLRCDRGALHLGGELAPGHSRGVAGQGPRDHRRLRGDGRVRPPRAERPAVHTSGSRLLAQRMWRLANDPRLAERLGRRGYLQSNDGNVPDMVEHSLAVEAIYRSLIGRSERP